MTLLDLLSIAFCVVALVFLLPYLVYTESVRVWRGSPSSTWREPKYWKHVLVALAIYAAITLFILACAWASTVEVF